MHIECTKNLYQCLNTHIKCTEHLSQCLACIINTVFPIVWLAGLLGHHTYGFRAESSQMLSMSSAEMEGK